jgi:hypothetical protein
MQPTLHHAIMSCGSEQSGFPTIAYCINQEAGPMKALTATALLLVLSVVALAVERPRLALVNADINMRLVRAMRENIGSVGAMRERDYFEAPQSPFNASFPCRLEPDIFAKTRLAQSCR